MDTYGITTNDFGPSNEDYASFGFYKTVDINGVNYEFCYDFMTEMSDYDDLHISDFVTDGSGAESHVDEDDLSTLIDVIQNTAKDYLRENYDACLERHQLTEENYGE